MKLGDMPAFPCEVTYSEHGELQGIQTGNSSGICPGMTLRQHYAGLAMQSLLTSMYGSIFAEAFKRGEIGKTKANEAAELRKLIADASLTFADELCAALEKQP